MISILSSLEFLGTILLFEGIHILCQNYFLMTPFLVLSIMVVYFGILITIAAITARGADTNTFFTANRQSPWFLVAFGMIGSFGKISALGATGSCAGATVARPAIIASNPATMAGREFVGGRLT